MKKKVSFEVCYDGRTFATKAEAHKHLAKCYDDAIRKLTQEITETRDGKHGDLIHWIDQNHERFDTLQQIKDDHKVDGDDEDCTGCRYEDKPGDEHPCDGCIRNSVDQYETEGER